MTLLLIFLSFLLGIAFKKAYIAIGIVIFFVLLKTILSKNKKMSIAIFGIFLLGIGVSLLPPPSYNLSSRVGIVYETKDNYFLLSSRGEKLYCYEIETKREIGDIVEIKGVKEKLDFVSLESEFDFTNYLNNKGIYYSLEIEKITTKFSNPIRLKSFKRWFLNKFDENTRISVNSILFSDHDDNELTNAVSSLHLSRLINAGGLYFNALIGAFVYLFEKKLKTKWSKLAALGVSSFYLILTFPRFSIIRLTVFYIAKWINEYVLKKKVSYLDLTSIIGIIFLFSNLNLRIADGEVMNFSSDSSD